MDPLAEMEAVARRACRDRDLTLGLVLTRIKQRRLYLLVGSASVWDYVARRRQVYGFGRRQAERLVRCYSVLRLLQDQAERPTHERQARPVCNRYNALAPGGHLG